MPFEVRCPRTALGPEGDEETWFEYPPSPSQSIAVPRVQLHSMNVSASAGDIEPKPALRGLMGPPANASAATAAQLGGGPPSPDELHQALLIRRAPPSTAQQAVTRCWPTGWLASGRPPGMVFNGVAQCDSLVCEMGPVAFSRSIDTGALTAFPVPVPTRFQDAFSEVQSRLRHAEPGLVSEAVRATAMAAAERRAAYPVVPTNTTLDVESDRLMTVSSRGADNVLRRASDSTLLELAALPSSRLWPGASLVLHFAYYNTNNP